jgi:hypothetical protein
MLNMSDVFKMLMATVTRLDTVPKVRSLNPLLSSLLATVGLVLVDVGCHSKGRWSKDVWEEGAQENAGHKSKQQEAGKFALWGT